MCQCGQYSQAPLTFLWPLRANWVSAELDEGPSSHSSLCEMAQESRTALSLLEHAEGGHSREGKGPGFHHCSNEMWKIQATGGIQLNVSHPFNSVKYDH